VVLDPAKEMADVYRCMNVLKQSEKKLVDLSLMLAVAD
jgi:hypothetical protein